MIDWVSEGSPGGASSARTFATGEASVHVYSTLRPETAPDGSLRLSTVSQNALNGLVILVVAVFGLPLYRRSLRIQIALLLLITTVMLLIGIFAPNWPGIYSAESSWPPWQSLILIWLIGHVTKSWSRLATRSSRSPVPTAEGASPFGENPGGQRRRRE